ncbi:MAG: ankyrin repeat domain-containing protein [Bacteroidales bacterium]|nr:ankyrin repeat domain-containing protein [Bacteroidales bacterium]
MTTRIFNKQKFHFTFIILFLTHLLHAQYNEIPSSVFIDENHSLSLLNEDNILYILIINPNTRQANAYTLFEPAKDSLPAFVFNTPSPTLILKKKDLVCSNNLEIKQFNDLLDVDKSLLKNQFKANNLDIYEPLHHYFGYYGLREKNIYQVGTTCFIGTIDDLKKGNYSVIGINTSNSEVIYYLAFYEKKYLQKVFLSNGLTIGNFINKYQTYSIAASDLNEQTYIYETYSGGKNLSATISSKRDDFFVKYDHGGYDLSYLFPPNKQTNFKIYQKPDEIFIYDNLLGDYKYYSTYGRSIAPIQFLGDPGEKPITLNFAKYNDPNGTNVTIGEYKPKIVMQEHVEYDIKRDYKINIAQFDNTHGIPITFSLLDKRYVAIGQITESGWVNRHINISDNFNFLMGNKPVVEDGFLRNKLHLAVWNENEDSVQILLKQEEPINIVNIDWQTPLHLAAFKNNHYITRQLVDSGAKVYFPDHYGNTPLHIAAAFGDNETIDFLIDAGRNEVDEFGIKGIDISNKCMETPLFLSVLNNNLSTAKTLLNLGAYTYGWNQYGQIPLDLATYKLINSIDISEKNITYEITKALLDKTKWLNSNKISVPTLSGSDSITNMYVSNIKFYESSDQITPYNQREYKRIFASTNTRYLGYEVLLNYTLEESKKDFTLKAIWYKGNGKEIYTEFLNNYVDANWQSSFHTGLYGNVRYGAAWKPGLYYIDIYLNDQKMANAYFVVY